MMRRHSGIILLLFWVAGLFGQAGAQVFSEPTMAS
jgi:hypothetical protein